MPPLRSPSIAKRERGNLYLAGEDIDFVANHGVEASLDEGILSQVSVTNRVTRDGTHYHMTLLSVKEIRDLVTQLASDSENNAALRDMLDKGDAVETNTEAGPIERSKRQLRRQLLGFCETFLKDRTTRAQDWFVLGIGRKDERGLVEGERNSCVFLVCSYPRGAVLRRKLGLTPKDFHITLGFNQQDIHGCSKGVQSLLRKQPHPVAATPNPIISTPRELIEQGRIAILGGNAYDIVSSTTKTENKGRFYYASILLKDAESWFSFYKLERKPIVSQNATALLAVLVDQSFDLKMLLDLLEMRCQILGRTQNFEIAVDYANLWIDTLELAECMEVNTKINLKSIALGYKGAALYMQKDWSKAYPCLRESYELRLQESYVQESHRLKTRCVRKTRLRAHRERETVSLEMILVQCCKVLGHKPPLPPLIPFPRTAHLFDTGGSAVTSDDWVLSDMSSFFRDVRDEAHAVVEEKIDGANLGLSLSSDLQILTQNRCHYVSDADHSQFGTLPCWIQKHQQALVKILSSPADFKERAASQGLILYGEWCSTKHSIKYNQLPGYFIAFDLYDRLEEKFYSRKRLHELLYGSAIPCAPVICSKKFGPYPSTKSNGMKKASAFQADVRELLETKSRFATNGGFVEGVVLRIEDKDSKWLEKRVKVVRPDFVQGIQEHWIHGPKEKQIVDFEFGWNYCSTNSDGPPDSYCLAPSVDLGDAEKTDLSRERIDPRQQTMVVSKKAGTNNTVILPRNFSFLWHDEVALSSQPISQEQIQALSQNFGTSLVVTLTEEEPLPESWFGEVESCTNLFVPVPNYRAPSLDQMNEIMDAIEEAIKGGGTVVVHCGGGKGRAGTVGACLLLRYGSLGILESVGASKAPKSLADLSTHFNSSTAIDFLRTTRPGSIETKEQEIFVRKYSDYLWKNKAQTASTKQIENSFSDLSFVESKESHASTVTNPISFTKAEQRAQQKELESIQRAQRKAPRCILLMGLPGSGKSTFANHLAESYPPKNRWLILNQDKLGKKECERLAKSCKNQRVILDRCNLRASEREYWLELLHSPPRGDVLLVYLATDKETCIRRIEKRTNHETIPNGAGNRIVAEMQQRLEPPTRFEAKRYARVEVVHTVRDGHDVLRSLGALVQSGPTQS